MKKTTITMLLGGLLLLSGCANMNQVLTAMSNTQGINNAIQSVIGLDKVSAPMLPGTWQYRGPGCAFTSENLLAKAGGEMAAVQIEDKLLPYYQKVGIASGNTAITFSNDGSFSAKVAGKSFSGTYAFDEAKQQIKLQTLLFSINCYTKRESNGMSVLFEAKKLLTLLQTMSAMSGSKDLQTLGDFSKNYDGARIGFDMAR